MSWDDPIPREVYEEASRNAIENIDFWRGETLKAEAEVERLREAGIRLHALLDETLSSPPGTVYTAAVEEALDRWGALVDATDAR